MIARTLFCLLLVVPLTPLSAEETVDPLATYEGLSAALGQTNTGLILIDLRDKRDFLAGHIPRAVSIPLNSLYYNPPTKDLKTTIVLYDRFGNLCPRAYSILEGMGFKKIIIFGKISNWKAARVQ